MVGARERADDVSPGVRLVTQPVQEKHGGRIGGARFVIEELTRERGSSMVRAYDSRPGRNAHPGAVRRRPAGGVAHAMTREARAQRSFVLLSLLPASTRVSIFLAKWNLT